MRGRLRDSFGARDAEEAREHGREFLVVVEEGALDGVGILLLSVHFAIEGSMTA